MSDPNVGISTRTAHFNREITHVVGPTTRPLAPRHKVIGTVKTRSRFQTSRHHINQARGLLQINVGQQHLHASTSALTDVTLKKDTCTLGNEGQLPLHQLLAPEVNERTQPLPSPIGSQIARGDFISRGVRNRVGRNVVLDFSGRHFEKTRGRAARRVLDRKRASFNLPRGAPTTG